MKELLLTQNRHFIAFNKPANIPLQPDKTGDRTLLEAAEQYCKTKLHIIHRIDRPATGVVIFAKTPEALAAINRQFAERTVQKTYLAVIERADIPEKALLQNYLQKDERRNLAKVVDATSPQAQLAELQYRIKESSERFHLLEIELFTGRHHQIRVQLAALGCPIKGDTKYGYRRGNTDHSIHLHAWQLKFAHPSTSEPVDLKAALPEDKVWSLFNLPPIQQPVLKEEE